jgi:hypothetical protein
LLKAQKLTASPGLLDFGSVFIGLKSDAIACRRSATKKNAQHQNWRVELVYVSSNTDLRHYLFSDGRTVQFWAGHR